MEEMDIVKQKLKTLQEEYQALQKACLESCNKFRVKKLEQDKQLLQRNIRVLEDQLCPDIVA